MFDMPVNATVETGAKVLATAEMLFAEHGYDGVSLRRITADAGVNLAAVNYHYSDKQSLYLEILTYRLRQLSSLRLARLSAAETRVAGEPVPLAELVEILAQPLLSPDEFSMPGFNAASRRLLGRTLIEPLGFLAPLLAADFQPAVARCGQALRRHLPALPPADFIWRYSFVVGALHHAAATLHDMKTLTRGLCANNDAPAALRNYCQFASAALTANDFR
jgi:AcrR family transcriptional regulator